MRSPLAIALSCALVLGAAGGVASAQAAPVARASVAGPTQAPTVHDADTSHNGPLLSWDAVPAATAYTVQVATDPAFSHVVWSTNPTTTALQVTPPVQLPTGTLYWHVAAKGAGGTTGQYSDSVSFDNHWGEKAPDLTQPGVPKEQPIHLDSPYPAILTFPSQPAVFRWAAVPGAKAYTLQVDDAPDFVNPQVNVTTSNRSYVLPEPQTVDQPYYWRVQAQSNAGPSGAVLGQWSDTWHYQWKWDDAPKTPANGTNVAVTDVEFTWEPVTGAKLYELQVSPNGDWANNVTLDTKVMSTSYAPSRPLPNGAYYWRVRAEDATGQHEGHWSEQFTFTRSWNPAIELLTPAADPDGPGGPPSVADNPRFSWTPIDHASSYDVQVSPDPNFSNNVGECLTNHTSFTPYSGCTLTYQNRPWTPGTLYYWRVRGIDNTSAPVPPSTSPATAFATSVLGRWSETGQFVSAPGVPAIIPPPRDANPAVPVLTWKAVRGAAQYQVSVKAANGATVTATTYATSYTPTSVLSTASGNTFTWTVASVDGSGRLSGTAGSSFTLGASTLNGPSPEALAPDNGASSQRMPALEWTPVPTATKYVVHLATNDVEQTPLTTTQPYAAFTATGEPLAPGTYTWWAEARDAQGKTLGTGQPRNFTIAPTSLLGAGDYLTPRDCTGDATCAVADTPTFSWNGDPDAARYEVTIATDPGFTHVVKSYNTAYTSLTPAESLLDSQAGQSYYWFVRPCRVWLTATDKQCGPEPGTSASQGIAPAFRKQSPPVSAKAVASVANQMTFRWSDFLCANEGYAAGTCSGTPDPGSAAPGTATQEAKQYRIQVSTVADFNNPLDTQVVDGTSYTPFAKTYPEGPLYWRVQAIDGSDNSLTWSDVQLTQKESPAPAATTDPESDGTDPNVRWTPLPYAAQYTVEIYRSSDNTITDRPLVSATTKFSAFTPTSGLPAGSYAWRVRTIDAGGLVGRWSAVRSFTVSADTPVLDPVSPNPITSGNALFSWSGVSTAAYYVWQQSSSPDFTRDLRTQKTVMTAWSPTTAPADGTFYWRVVAYNGDDGVLSTSATSSFLKDSTAPTVTSRAPVAPGLQDPLPLTFSEPVSGVSASALHLVVAASSKTVAVTATPGPSAMTTTASVRPVHALVPGETYTLSAGTGIHDAVGNPLNPFTLTFRTSTAVENTSAALREHWDRDTSRYASGGSYDESRTAGSSARITFAGSNITVYGTRAPTGGYASVYVDGRLANAAVSFASSTTRYKVPVWSVKGLVSGTHTIELRVLGTHPKGSTDSWVRLDAYTVGTLRNEQTSAAVVEHFHRTTASAASGGSYDYVTHVSSADSGSQPSYDVTFHGTRVSVVGVRSSAGGTARVYLDNVYQQAISLRGTTMYGYVWYSSPALSDATHTIRIVAVGTSSGSGSTVAVDAVQVG